jgi:hypothetical protein
LREEGIARSNSDVGSQKKLVACALAVALDGNDERLLSTGWYGADWIDELRDLRELTGT